MADLGKQCNHLHSVSRLLSRIAAVTTSKRSHARSCAHICLDAVAAKLCCKVLAATQRCNNALCVHSEHVVTRKACCPHSHAGVSCAKTR